MKKLLALGLILAASVGMMGCEKKNTGAVQLLPQGERYTLQIWAAEDANFLEALGREFMAAAKTPGLNVKVVEFESQEELNETLLDKMSEATGPDIVLTNGEWVAYNKNKLVPRLDDVSFTPDLFRNTFVRSANETLIQDEKVYGVPLGVDTLGVIYNQEHLIDRLSDRNTSAPTWEDLVQDTSELTTKNNSVSRFLISGTALGRIDNISYPAEILENIMLQSGTIFFSEDRTEALLAKSIGVTPNGKRSNFGIDSVDLFLSFGDSRYKNYSWNEYMGQTQDKEYADFISGKVSQVFGYAKDYQRIIDTLEGKSTGSKRISSKNVKVGMLPQIADPNVAANRNIVGRVKALAIPRSTKSPDVAWRFLKFAVRDANLQSYFEETKTPTPRVDLIKEQEAVSQLGVFVRQAKFAKPNILPVQKTYFYEVLLDAVGASKDTNMTTSKSISALDDVLTKKIRDKLEREKELATFAPKK